MAGWYLCYGNLGDRYGRVSSSLLPGKGTDKCTTTPAADKSLLGLDEQADVVSMRSYLLSSTGVMS
jgi:hypothetical protein